MKNAQLNNLGILILRIGLSASMLTHGISKAQKLFAGGEIKFLDPIGLGPIFSLVLTTTAELIFAGLVLIGFRTRITSIPVAIAMFVAVFFVHVNDPWAKKELAVIYLIGFMALVFTGSGKYSVDGIFKK